MNDWQQWRKLQRANLVAQREAIPEKDHNLWSAAITLSLQQGFSVLKKNTVGSYLPIRGEYDPRPAMVYFGEQGATVAIPEITKKDAPLCFRKWWHNAPMKQGAYGIPVPDNTEQVNIDIALIPMVGFDQQGYRLGYGSGYYDRTLAVSNPCPLVIGIAFEMLRLDSVHPQAHDIPMDFIITEAGVYQTIDKKLSLISTEKCTAKM
jgi:5-formyltetrahydrofolate cyclo-ligase